MERKIENREIEKVTDYDIGEATQEVLDDFEKGDFFKEPVSFSKTRRGV